MRLSKNRRILATGALTLVLAFLVSLTPWYDAYCAYDARWTCARLRKSIQWNYEWVLEADLTTYAPGTEDLLRQAQRRAYDAQTVDPIPEEGENPAYHYYAIPGLCRDGGTIHVVMDDAGWIQVTCDESNHDVDYTEILDVINNGI